ncbi:hypothetical protein ACKI1J_15170 [Streptomyces scabiei]|uniref:hypothetical protein n=1 Tax=Streptomyces scabiei TaxID=1930 RepID=UPI0038F76151
MNAAEFNALYEVGVPVFAYPGGRPEDFPSDPRLVTRTRSKASVLGGHTDVVWVDGHSACIALSHVDVVSEDEFTVAREAETAAAVAERGALPMPVPEARQTAGDGELARARRYIARLEAALCICLPVRKGDDYLHAADCPVAAERQAVA